jgi:1-deoxy-D-xylulose-5-phosphate synthase
MKAPLRLATLRSPADLRGRTAPELESLCAEIRSALIEKVCASGGHLGSNLGVVELTVALHASFDFLRDRLVFDVGHQCYPHKMLTGRFERFGTLRSTGGLSGFCSRDESPYDLLTAGHAGTAISYALGQAEAARGLGGPDGDPWSVALVGDAGFGAGVAFEGLTQAAERNARLIVVLNDNEWSIARSVGALSRYLSRIRSSRTLHKAYERLKDATYGLPWVGTRLEEMGEVMRRILVPGHVFEELGVNYVGPLDGHDLAVVQDALERARRIDSVTLIHFLTEKGRGYGPAAEDPERAHGVKPSAPAKLPGPAEAAAAAAARPQRKAFTALFEQALVACAERDPRVHAITAAMPSGTGLARFAEEFPTRFHDVGITEQHAVALAGGMATAGLRPVAAIYSTFLQRGYDQVFQEVALQRAPVVFALDRAGLVGQDGPTHMGLYDLAYLRPFPGFVLASPRDAVDLRRMLDAGVAADGPWALRWPRGDAQEALGSAPETRPPMTPGTGERLLRGGDGCVLALGAMVEPALAAARLLREEHDRYVEVWDARFCKPLDERMLDEASTRFPWIATVEEHGLQGGFGSAVAEWLADHGRTVRLTRHGVGDVFVPHMSTREEQLRACGLDAVALARRWAAELARGAPAPTALL